MEKATCNQCNSQLITDDLDRDLIPIVPVCRYPKCPNYGVLKISQNDDVFYFRILLNKDKDMPDDNFDEINNPSHYNEGREIQPIDVVEDWELGFHLGNALKYIARAGRKGSKIKDLDKAIWMINREIKKTKEPNKEESVKDEQVEDDPPPILDQKKYPKFI